MWSGPAALYVLVALSHGPRHGLGIADEVERFTDGAVVLGPGTLYRVLRDLAEEGLIRRVPSPDEAHPHRKYYELSDSGRETLGDALEELESVASAARRGLGMPRPEGAR
jgi:DNA-binding PadR family transcriptional regulator